MEGEGAERRSHLEPQGLSSKRQKLQSELRKAQNEEMFRLKREKVLQGSRTSNPNLPKFEALLKEIKGCLDQRDFRAATGPIRAFAEDLSVVGDEDFSLQLTAVYDLAFENSIFGALHTFLKNNTDPADRVFGVRIISVFGSSSSNRIIMGLVQTQMHELLVSILLQLQPEPENDFLFKFCMRALANMLSGNMGLIEQLARKHLLALVPKIVEFRRFREATFGAVQFLSSLNSDEIIDEVRVVFSEQIVEICVGVLEQKYDEYTVLDVLQVLSGATDARKDADEQPFIRLNEFLFGLGFFGLITDLFKDEHVRDQLKVLALRCLGNALSLDDSPEMDKKIIELPLLVESVMVCSLDSTAPSVILEGLWVLSNMLLHDTVPVILSLSTTKRFWEKILELVTKSFSTKVKEASLLCLANLIRAVPTSEFVRIVNDEIEGLADLLFQIINELEEKGGKGINKGFLAIEFMLDHFATSIKEDNRVTQHILRQWRYKEAIERAANGEFQFDKEKCQEQALSILNQYFDTEDTN